jgi:hypothetical protein
VIFIYSHIKNLSSTSVFLATLLLPPIWRSTVSTCKMEIFAVAHLAQTAFNIIPLPQAL